MSLYSRFRSIFSKRSSVVPDHLWRSYGVASAAGVTVNEQTALSASAVFAAIRNISEDVAGTPFHVYRRLEPQGKQRLADHWLADLMEFQPNPDTDDFSFRQAITANALLWGNGYAEIERRRNGQPLALWRIAPWRVQVRENEEGRVVYLVDNKPIDRMNLLHLKGFTTTGFMGELICRHAKDSIGIILAAEKFGARFFGSGTRPSGVVTTPNKMDPEAAKSFLNQWAEANSGVENAGKTILLDNGKKWEKVSTDPDESQFFQTRMFQLDEVARWFRIPPHKLQNLGRSTWSNIEQQSIEYVSDTLLPWFRKWESEVKLKLLGQTDRSIYGEHLADAHLRGDAISRTQAFSLQFRSGALTLDEWRSAENRNPLPDGQGSKHFVPRDLITVDELLNPKPEPEAVTVPPQDPEPADDQADDPEPDQSETIRQLADIQRRSLTEGITKALRVEADKVTRKAKKNELDPWKDEFYQGNEAFIRSIIEAPVRSFVDSVIAITGSPKLLESRSDLLKSVDRLAARHNQQSLDDLADPEGLIQRVGGWAEFRPDDFCKSAFDELFEQVQLQLGKGK